VKKLNKQEGVGFNSLSTDSGSWKTK